MKIEMIFDKATFTLTYIVSSNEEAVIIDPVWNYDQASSRLSTQSIDQVLNYLKNNDLKVKYILETHAHADHLSGAQLVKKKFPNALLAIGEKITTVQKRFKKVFNLKNIQEDGEQFDILLNESSVLSFGDVEIKTIFTPGHTPACCSYLIGEKHLFTGDTLFMPDFGTGRCDFPDGSAEDLYNSVADKIYKLDENIMIYTGHDYQPNGRELRYCATIKEQKEENIQLKASTSKEEYINFRTERDAVLSAPKLLLPSIQVNINAGTLPEPEDNKTSYLKIPLKQTPEIGNG